MDMSAPMESAGLFMIGNRHKIKHTHSRVTENLEDEMMMRWVDFCSRLWFVVVLCLLKCVDQSGERKRRRSCTMLFIITVQTVLLPWIITIHQHFSSIRTHLRFPLQNNKNPDEEHSNQATKAKIIGLKKKGDLESNVEPEEEREREGNGKEVREAAFTTQAAFTFSLSLNKSSLGYNLTGVRSCWSWLSPIPKWNEL